MQRPVAETRQLELVDGDSGERPSTVSEDASAAATPAPGEAANPALYVLTIALVTGCLWALPR